LANLAGEDLHRSVRIVTIMEHKGADGNCMKWNGEINIKHKIWNSRKIKNYSIIIKRWHKMLIKKQPISAKNQAANKRTDGIGMGDSGCSQHRRMVPWQPRRTIVMQISTTITNL
jgi:hypothetical protein